MADALDALAFTSGRDVYFARDAFRPETLAGRRLIVHELAHVCQQETAPLGGDVIQRQQRDDGTRPEMEFTVWETYDWRELGKAFDSHRTEIEESIKIEFNNYADLAEDGAMAGVSEIFDPYEDELAWKGARASQLTGIGGILGDVGSIASALIGAGITEALTREGLRIDELKDAISSEVEERVDALRYERSDLERLIREKLEPWVGEAPPTPRESLVDYYVLKAAGEYRRLVDRGLPPSGFGSGGREFVSPGSDSMRNALKEYVADEIDAHRGVKPTFERWVVETYGPVVDEALRPPPPRVLPAYPGLPAPITPGSVDFTSDR